MSHLHQAIANQVADWRAREFEVEAFPAIAEILDFQIIASESGTRESRFLRAPQIDALCTYWWLRLCADTPHVLDLYQRAFTQTTALLESLALKTPAIQSFLLDCGGGLDALWDKIRTSESFVAEHKLEALRETITLAYPSYILALAMGAGRTTLMGAIIATESRWRWSIPTRTSSRTPSCSRQAPPSSARCVSWPSLPYDRTLPPRFYKHFAATVKLIFTRDGDPDIPVIRGDSFNVIVTNTEKIRITKETIRKGDLGGLVSAKKEDEATLSTTRAPTISSPRCSTTSSANTAT